MATEEECADAWARIRKAMSDAGLVLISTDAIKEGFVVPFEEEVSCPHCTEWNAVKAFPDQEIIVLCVGCGKKFKSVLVQYLTSEHL